jgi:hypothetical protein
MPRRRGQILPLGHLRPSSFLTCSRAKRTRTQTVELCAADRAAIE